MQQQAVTFGAFAGHRQVAMGTLIEVAVQTRAFLDQDQSAQVLIFSDQSGEQLEIDFRGTTDEVVQRLQAATESAPRASEESPGGRAHRRGPGRPKLGVVSREVTLLPRHWQWLERQPGGASVTLRKLVEQARKADRSQEAIRVSQEATDRFMAAIAGNLPGYEEATRALYAADGEGFDRQIDDWPADVRDFAKKLAMVALGGAARAS